MDSTAKTADLKEHLINRISENITLNKEHLSAKVISQREKASDLFAQQGFPTKKHEEYKYTDLSNVLNLEYELDKASELSQEQIDNFIIPGLEANLLVFINGRYQPSRSRIITDGAQLEIKALSEAPEDLLEKYLSTEAYTQQDPFAALNTASFVEGAFIRIPAGKVVDLPTFILNIADADTSNILAQPRIVILGEQNCKGSFIESYHTTGNGNSFTNAVTEVVLRQDAVIDHYKLEQDSEKSTLITNTTVILEGRSNFSSLTVTLNGGIVRNNLNVILKAEHSEATFFGLYYLTDKQVVDNHTMVDHAVPNCFSNELYKGILDGKSTGVFNGKIFVKKDAQKTNAFQSNKNVLLSRDAVMNTKPQLEIFADDVKCSHGATVGQLEEEALFYLRARGIGEDSARALLLLAFAQDVVDHIKIEPLRNYLSQAIEQRLLK